MHFASLLPAAAILATVIGAIPHHSQSRGLAAKGDDSLDLLASTEDILFTNILGELCTMNKYMNAKQRFGLHNLNFFDWRQLVSILQANPDQVSTTSNNLDLFSDDTTISSSSLDSCMMNPTSKRDEGLPLLGRSSYLPTSKFNPFVTDWLDMLVADSSPASSCDSSHPVTKPSSDLTVPDLDLNSLELYFQGSGREIESPQEAEERKQREFEESKPWWSLENVPFLPYTQERYCGEGNDGVVRVPVCCYNGANSAGMARSCIYCTYVFALLSKPTHLLNKTDPVRWEIWLLTLFSSSDDGFKCYKINYQLCCEFLDFVSYWVDKCFHFLDLY